MHTKNNDDKLEKHKETVIFYSDASHYSIAKATRVLRIHTFGEIAKDHKWPCPSEIRQVDDDEFSWPHELPTSYEGSIDLNSLKLIVEPFAKEGYPLIFILN